MKSLRLLVGCILLLFDCPFVVSFEEPTDHIITYRYEFDFDLFDAIDTISILDSNTVLLQSHSSFSISFSIPNVSFSGISPNLLHYDEDSLFDSIVSTNSHLNLSSFEKRRRRLINFNALKKRGRYVADGFRRNFKDAEANCRHKFGDLASIMSKQEQENVENLCQEWNLGDCWIGYKRPFVKWRDGRNPTYLKWKPGEPNGFGIDEDCVKMKTTGQWDDIKCSESLIAICERPRVHVVGNYISIMRKLTFWEANQRCQELFSTDLATIEDAQENVQVRKACSAISQNSHCWIGLQRPWRQWNDRDPAKVLNWAEGQPDNAGDRENCAEIQPTQRWNDKDCNSHEYFVCNTLTHEDRIRRRAEKKKREQEREEELERQRQAWEDQLMKQMMSGNANAQTQQMQSGQGLYQNNGASPNSRIAPAQTNSNVMGKTNGLTTQYGNINSQKGLQFQMQSGGYGQKALETGDYGPGLHQGNKNMGPYDLSKPLQVGLGGIVKPHMGPYDLTRPLQVQLVSHGIASQHAHKRRRLGEYKDNGEVKCKMIDANYKLCISSDFVDVSYVPSFDYKPYSQDNVTRYFAQYSFDYKPLSMQKKQCKKQYSEHFYHKLCLELNGDDMILNGLSFQDDSQWNQIETIYFENERKSLFPTKLIEKCKNSKCNARKCKICLRYEYNENISYLSYKAIVRFLIQSQHNL